MRGLIYSIVTIRPQHPDRRIVFSKVVFDKTYRCLQATLSLAARLGLTLSSMVGIYFRRTLGNKGHPSGFATLSELVCDYTYLLIQCHPWNPSSLHPTTATPVLLPSSVPFAPALPICVPMVVPGTGSAVAFP